MKKPKPCKRERKQRKKRNRVYQPTSAPKPQDLTTAYFAGLFAHTFGKLGICGEPIY